MSEFFDNGAGYLLRLMLLCAVVFGVGRGALDLLMKMAGPEAKRVLRNENFVAIAFGLVVVLLVTWGLTVLHLYGYASLLGSLLAFIVIAAAFAPRFRAFLRRPWAEIDATFVAYAAGSATFWLLVDISEYPLRKAAALYLLQGSGLSPGQNGTQWPNFGTMIGTPILYTGHLITSISALLSHDAPFAFYVDGLYALNVLTAPALLIGAFLLFRRYLGTLFAIAAATVFCSFTLGVKIWSLRGESIGWILGFAFLIVVTDIIAALKDEETERTAIRLFPIAVLLFFGLVLTHAIAAVVAAFAAGAAGCYLIESRRSRDIVAFARFAALSAVLFVLLFGAFEVSFAGTSSLIESNRPPPAGDRDAAMQFDNVTSGVPINSGVPLVLARPPYASLTAMAEVAAWLPPALLAHADALRDFPRAAIARVQTLSRETKAAFVLLPIIFIIAYLTPLRRSTSRSRRRLFWISLTIYVCLVASIVYLDSKSVSLYPLAAAQRTFVYITFFYWLATGVAILDFASGPSRRVWIRLTAHVPFRLPISSAQLAGVLVACFTIGWFTYSVSPYLDRPISPTFLVQRLLHRTLKPLGSSAISETLEPMFEAMAFVREHTRPGDWVYSNVISYDNSFLYLTSGRRSLLEGTSIYQLYFVQREATARINRFIDFAMTGDPTLLSPHSVNYAVLERKQLCLATCYGSDVFAANFFLFDVNSAYRKVFANDEYVIYALTGRPQGDRIRLIQRLLPLCNAGALSPRKAVDACTTLISSVRTFAPVEIPAILAARGRAYRQLQNPARAASDFDSALKLQPGDASVAIALADTHLAIGNPQQAIDDCTRGISANAGDPDLYALRGRAEVMSGRLADAIRDFGEALRWRPSDAAARFERASASIADGRYLEAASDLNDLQDSDEYVQRAALALDVIQHHLPFRVSTALNLLAGCTGTGHPAARVSNCTELLGDLRPVEPNGAARILVSRGQAFEQLGEIEQARNDFDTALQLDPHEAGAFAALAAVDLRSGDHSRALADYDRAIAFDEDSPDLRYLRGVLRSALGDTDGAIADFDSALRLDQSYASAYYERALAYEVKHDSTQAISDLQRALQYNPSLVDASTQLKALQAGRHP